MSDFKPMLAKDADLTKVRWPQMIQPKLDGIRASVVNGKLVTRTLKAVPNAEIRAALETAALEGMDGELIVGSPTADDCYRRTASFVMSESKTGEPWSFYVFDFHDMGEASFQARYDALEDRFSWPWDERSHLVPATICADLAALDEAEALLIEQGYEGVILRDPSAAYKFGRSGKTGPLLKVKRFIDFEAEVVGFYEEMHNANEAKTNALGRTERSSHAAGKVGKGTLGGLIVRAVNGPAEGVEFRVGTGFDAVQRVALWAVRNTLVSRTAKIKSFPIGVKDKPRHPVWLGWRDLGLDG